MNKRLRSAVVDGVFGIKGLLLLTVACVGNLVYAQEPRTPKPLDPQEIVQKVWSVWKSRQDMVQSVHVEFSLEKYSAKVFAFDESKAKEVVEKQDSIKFYLSGSRSRLEKLMPYVEDNVSTVTFMPFIETCNGREGRTFSAAKGLVHKDYHSGTVGPAEKCERGVYSLHVLNIVKPIGFSGFVDSREDVSYLSEGQFDGQKSVTLVVNKRGDSSYRVILDSERFKLLGVEMYVGATLRSKSQYNYDPSEDLLVPFPVTWSHTNLDQNGTVMNHIDCVRKSIEFNQAYPESLFLVEFPPATRVYDARSGEEKVYLVEEDGTWMPFSQVTSVGSNRYGWLLILLLAVAAFVTYRFYISRRKVIRHASS